MSEINVLEIPVVPVMPDVLASQSIAVMVPIGTTSFKGTLQPSSTYFSVSAGVLTLAQSIYEDLLSISGMKVSINDNALSIVDLYGITTSLSSRVTTNESSINSLGTSLGAVTASVSSLYLTSASLSSRVGQNESDITSLYSSITNINNDLGSLWSSAGNKISVSYDSNYKLTVGLYNSDNTLLSSSMIDLPIEQLVMSVSYISGDLVIYLENGTSTIVPLGDLVNGLEPAITSFNKLNADLVDDNNTTNKFVTASLITDIESNTLARHTHSNKTLLDSYTQTEENLSSAVAMRHSHNNKALLDTYDFTNDNVSQAISMMHTHNNKSLLDTYDVLNADISSAVSLKHSHSNKTILDAITQSDLDNLSILSSVISGGGFGGTNDYTKLLNVPIYNNIGLDDVVLDNELLKVSDTLSMITYPVTSTTNRLYWNIFACIPSSSYPTVDRDGNIIKDSAILLNELLEEDENMYVINLSGISYYTIQDPNISSHTESVAILLETRYSDYYGYLVEACPHHGELSEFNMLTYMLYSERKASLSYNDFEQSAAVSQYILHLQSFYSSQWHVQVSNYSTQDGVDSIVPFYFNVPIDSILTIYQPTVVDNNFADYYYFFPKGKTYSTHMDKEGIVWSPLATISDIESKVQDRLQVINYAPSSSNAEGKLSLVYMSQVPENLYDGYIYITYDTPTYIAGTTLVLGVNDSILSQMLIVPDASVSSQQLIL